MSDIRVLQEELGAIGLDVSESMMLGGAFGTSAETDAAVETGVITAPLLRQAEVLLDSGTLSESEEDALLADLDEMELPEDASDELARMYEAVMKKYVTATGKIRKRRVLRGKEKLKARRYRKTHKAKIRRSRKKYERSSKARRNKRLSKRKGVQRKKAMVSKAKGTKGESLERLDAWIEQLSESYSDPRVDATLRDVAEQIAEAHRDGLDGDDFVRAIGPALRTLARLHDEAEGNL